MDRIQVRKIGSITETDKCFYHYNWTIDLHDQFDAQDCSTLKSPDFTMGEENLFIQLYFTQYQCELSLISKRSTEGIKIIISVEYGEQEIDIQMKKSMGDKVTFNMSKLRHFGTYTKELRVVCVLITSKNQIRKTRCSITNDLELILRSEKLSDVTLIVDENQFHVHKTILASRSPVFLAMFENNMVENIENKVEITDIDYEVMKIIIVYIYTDEVENLEEKALNVLPAANKYSLEGLKFMCGKALINTLTVDNALQILILADMYNVNNLKQKTLTFIAEHLREIISTEEFNRFKNCHRQFIDEILATLATKIII